MLNFKIDETRCIKCGLCVKDCPSRIIELDNFPKIDPENEGSCIKCQHCLAICPTAALSILNVDPDECSKLDTLPNSEQLELMIKSRRSTRSFRSEEIPKEVIENLLDSASYAPTGHGNNSVQFHVTESKNITDILKEKVYAGIKSAVESGESNPFLDWLYKLQQVFETKGIDLIFREAPHVVIATAPEAPGTPKEDTIIALSYLEILANSMGISTLWNGIAKYGIEISIDELRPMLGISEGQLIGYVMVLGKSDISYLRSTKKVKKHYRFIK
jgi:nitroreductase/NAD-dependent dihydropyrimidine dehydrogenase PreA subunit